MSETVLDIDALTLPVNAGEVFVLLGSKGAGKTTTIKMLTALLPPTSGEARVAGFSITHQAVSVDGSLTGKDYAGILLTATVPVLIDARLYPRLAT